LQLFPAYPHGDQLKYSPGGSLALLVGLAAAFITALLSIRWLLGYVSRHNFRPFAYYRIIAGVIILGLIVSGQM
jgi:undecaprenyl-diphosphatase